MRLTVLFDGTCGLCRRASRWLRAQPRYVELELLPAGSREVTRRFPDLDPASTLQELTVVADDGRVWRGAKAWVMCLWALKGYRGWALKLGHPRRLPWARRLVDQVSSHRHRISDWIAADAATSTAPDDGRTAHRDEQDEEG